MTRCAPFAAATPTQTSTPPQRQEGRYAARLNRVVVAGSRASSALLYNSHRVYDKLELARSARRHGVERTITAGLDRAWSSFRMKLAAATATILGTVAKFA